MEEKKLLEIIKFGESEIIEFKESFQSAQEVAKTICAFANTKGGILLIGVKPNKVIAGVLEDSDRLQQRIAAAVQTVHPPPNTSIEIKIIEDKKIAIVTTQNSDQSTFYSFQGCIYIRLGSTNKKLEAPEMIEFLQGRRLLCFDELTSSMGLEEIDEAEIRTYLASRQQTAFLEIKGIEEFLLSGGLAVKNGMLKLKNSAILLFGKQPTKFFPQIELKLVKFNGITPVEILAYQPNSSILRIQIEESIAFISKNTWREIIIGVDAKREEKPEYPPSVVREAVVNAIVHRDYFSKDSVQINIFDDRLEIISPGTLPTGLTRELLGTLSVQRNPIIYRILRDFGYVEGLGTGIPRMINEMRKHGLSDPIFEITPGFFRLILKNKKSGMAPIESIKDLNERQKKALKYLMEHKSIKSQTYAHINSVSRSTAINELNEMCTFKYIEKIGIYRGAYYIPKN